MLKHTLNIKKETNLSRLKKFLSNTITRINRTGLKT